MTYRDTGTLPISPRPRALAARPARASTARKRAAAVLVFVAAGGFAATAQAAVCYAVASAAWNVATTWASTSGGPAGSCASGVPIAGDTANIGELAVARAVTIPAGYTANVATLNIGHTAVLVSDAAKSLTLSAATSTLNVSGNLTINRPTTNIRTNALNVNAGTVNVTGNVTLAGTNTTASRVNRINITTGTLNITGDLVFIAGATANNYLDMSGGAARLNLGGAFTATVGTLSEGASSIFNYNGSVAQTVRLNIAAIDYYHLYLNNTNASGATLNANVTTANVFGDLRVQSGILNDGGFTVTGGAGDTFEVADGATFNYTQTTWVSGFTRSLGATSTVKYNRGGIQTVANENYGHLLLTNAGAKTLPGATMNVAGNLSMGGTATITHSSGTVAMNGSQAQTITLNSTGSSLFNLDILNTAATVSAGNNITLAGNFSSRPGATFSAGNYTHSVAGNFSNNGTFNGDTSAVSVVGNFTNNGTFTAGNSSVTFESTHFINNGTFTAGNSSVTFGGAVAQNISGTSATTFNNLILNKSANVLNLYKDTTVSNLLTFTAGNISTLDNTLIINNGTSNCGVSGSGGFVIGKLQKNFYSLLTSCNYELGEGSSTYPVTVTFASVTSPGSLTVSTTGGDHPQISSSSISDTDSVNRYWTFAKSGALGFTTYDAVFNYYAAECDVPANASGYGIQRYVPTTSDWTTFTVDPAATSTLATGTGFTDTGTTDDIGFAIGTIGSISGIQREKEYIYIQELFY